MRDLSRNKILFISLIIDIALLVIPAAFLWTQCHRLPEQVATHFGPDGSPDGWSSIPIALFGLPLIGIGVALLLLLIGWGSRSLNIMAPVSVGMSIMLAFISFGSTFSQFDGGTARIGPYLFFGVIAMVIVGVSSYLWLRDRIEPVPIEDCGTFAPAMPGHPDTRSWRGKSRGGGGFKAIAVVVAGLGVFLTWLMRDDPWMAAAIAILVFSTVPLMLLSLQDIHVDASGVTTRALGFRMHHTPLEQIVAAGHVRVDPMGEFGGFGWRGSFDGKREGLVNSSGEALIFQRVGRKDYVITTDGAADAARVLQMLVTRGGGGA